nr:restriction endonuclease subunit S [Marinobacter sediminum]
MGLPFLQGNAEFGLEHPTPRLWCTRPKKISSKGDLLFSVRAPVGAINRSDQSYCIGRGLAAINVHSSQKALRKFQLLASVESFKKLLTGSTFEAISTDDLKNLLLCIPNEGEIGLITNFLDKKTAQIDEAIAIKEQQIALLKELKQIIIRKAVTQGLDPNVPMKDPGVDWIGEIPEHWRVESNRSLFAESVEPGREGLPLLSVSIHSGVSTEEVSDEDHIRGRVKIQDKTKYVLVKPGDVVFNMMRAWQGGIGAVTSDGMVSPAYIVARPKADILAEFFEYQYRCPEFIQQMDRYSKGITDFRKRLYWDSFKQLQTVVPPKSEQIDIIRYIQEASAAADSGVSLLVSQIEKLKEYKTTLINSAITGKIKVTSDMVEA